MMEATTDTVRATATGILLDGDVSTVHAAHDMIATCARRWQRTEKPMVRWF